MNTPAFLAAVRASGLVPADKLDELAAVWAEETGPVPAALVDALVGRGLLTPWQCGFLEKGKTKGFHLGKYRLLDLLGAGGMGSVYLAEHADLGHKVAIKVLPVKNLQRSSFLDRFRREASAAARLNHPNIARAFDLDQSGRIHFIVMEYVNGVDLHAHVKRHGPLDMHEAVECIRQVALGLDHAHGQGFIHRDIKPANLILDEHGLVKILDLGLALPSDETGSNSLTRRHRECVLGTADFLAPEQSRDSRHADPRSDIYSLGCTLYYLLVGKPPFDVGKSADRIRSHREQPPPSPLELRPGAAPEIVELCLRMMEKHPDARPRSCREIADALATWQSNTPRSQKDRGDEPPPVKRPPLRHGGSAPWPRDGVFGKAAASSRDLRAGSSSIRIGLPAGPPRSGCDGSGSSDVALTTTPGPVSASLDTVVTPRGKVSVRRKSQRVHRGSWLGREWLGQPLGLWLLMLVMLVTIAVLTTRLVMQ